MRITSGELLKVEHRRWLTTHRWPGDTRMVWKLDRLGRSVTQLVEFASQLHSVRTHHASLTDGIHTATPLEGSSSTSWPQLSDEARR